MRIQLSKVSIIVKREYLTRVRGKGFIISTILAPVFLLAIFLIPILTGDFDSSNTKTRYAIIDQTNSVGERMLKLNPERFFLADLEDLDSLRSSTLSGEMDGYILITENVLNASESASFFSAGSGGLSITSELRDNLRSAVREELLSRTNVSEDIRSIFEIRPDIESKRITDTGEKDVNEGMSFIIAYIMAMAIYMAMFGYGSLIMQGVIEEKTNRIVEVIVSAAKPMELLLGKVIGIVSLGMTQIIIWFLAFTGIGAIVAPLTLLLTGSNLPVDSITTGQLSNAPSDFTLPEIDLSIWLFFAVFYVLGFLIYGAIFAALGSAADNPQDVQHLALPVYLPIIIPMLLLMPVTSDPNSTLAIVTSMIPLFSPILMMSRIVVTDVPLWQSLGSIGLMIGSFLALLWLSAKIYRVGILMYGKKISFGELYRWIKYS
jgi:ABC-2 type transport system permease protein